MKAVQYLKFMHTRSYKNLHTKCSVSKMRIIRLRAIGTTYVKHQSAAKAKQFYDEWPILYEER